MHEIVTLQFGQRSNYLATHFWNVQESYFTYADEEESPVNHDIHFRAGQAPDGTETYTPRTVIYDLKGGFGALRKINALYEAEEEANGPLTGLWDGQTSTQRETPINPSQYQIKLELGLPTPQLHDSDVRYWSDFNRVYFHPRSIVQLNQYELNSQLMPFENWSAGEDLFDQTDKESDLLDRDVRFFAEECDHMQGFQIFTGADDAWGGFSAKFLDSLRDEYPKTSIWAWGIEDTTPASRDVKQRRAVNAARSLRSFGQQSSAYMRLATQPTMIPSYVNLTAGALDWRTTGLLCSAVETMTLPTRLRPPRNRYASLSLLQDSLNVKGDQNIFELSMSVKCPASQNNANHGANGHVNGHVNGRDSSEEAAQAHVLDISFLPGPGRASEPTHTFSEIEMKRWKIGSSSAPNRNVDSEQEKIMTRRTGQDDETIIDKFNVSVLFPNLDTFPEDLFRIPTTVESGFEITAALTASSYIKTNLLAVRDSSIRAFAVDERESLYSDLTSLADGYSFGWESDADSGEDD